ncbi:MAG TPA: cellulose binding domain-containing protein [Nonomuraea sp.]|nr:cellulose binding domain-containing protein [Nonomuraea sp.]
MPRTRRRFTKIATAVVMMLSAAVVGVVVAPPASAVTVCEQYGTVVAGNYVIQNNRWGTTATQCINTTSNGFSITQQDGTGNTSGAPVSYPSIFLGCHYSNCSPNSPLPRQISSIGSAPSSIGVTYPGSGTWNASYDIWLNATTDVSGVQDTEIMIWLNRQGSIQPIGSQTGTANLAGRTWQVWTGSNGANNVVSYLSTSPITGFNFDVRDFITDTLGRGSQYGTTSWYLTSVQAGFEPWIGGVGLAVNSFSASVGGGNQTQPPGTPGTPTASNVTSSAATLSWSPSSGTVSSYQIERATGATSTNFTQVGTSASPSFTNTGLSANTTYRYRVRATNSAGTSGYSGIVNVTTQSGGGTGDGACAGSGSVQSQWDNGYVMLVTVTNTGTAPISGWTSSVTLPSGQQATGSWPGTLTTSGQTISQRSVSWNASLSPGQSTTWGFQATRAAGSTQVPTSFACTSP